MFGRKTKEFIRFPGRGLSIATPATLWAGPDHLVLIRRTGYTETYKRFYYADIQAAILQVTRHRAYWNLVFAVPFAMSLLWLLFAHKEQAVAAVIMASIWGLFLLVNTLRGPCCSFRIQTRINEEKISMISRLRAGFKAWSMLEERVVAAQGALSRDQLLSGGVTPPAPKPIALSRLKKGMQRTAAGPVSLGMHSAFMAGLGLQVLFSVLLSLFSLWWLLLLHLVCLVTVFVVGIVALARQSGGSMDSALRFWTGTGFSLIVAHGVFLFTYLFIKLILELQTQVATKAFRSMSDVMTGLFTHPFGFTLMVVSAIVFLILTAVGVVLLARERAAGVASVPPVPPAG